MNPSRRTSPDRLLFSSSAALAAVLLGGGGAFIFQLQTTGSLSPTIATATVVVVGIVAWAVTAAGFVFQQRRIATRAVELLADIDDVVVVVRDEIVQEAVGPTASVLGADNESIVGLTLGEILQSAELDRVRIALAHAVGSRDTVSVVASLPTSHAGNAATPDHFVDLIIRDRTADRRFHAVVITIRDVTSRATAERLLVSAAAVDPQTQLPNRARFLDLVDAEIHRARRSGDHITVLSVGIDRHMTMIEGFCEADVTEIMQEMARRIRSAVRVEDAVSRCASDQFAVLLGGLQPAIGRAYAIDVADRIATSLNQSFYISGSKLEIAVSVGAAHRAQGGTELTPNELLSVAEESLRSVRANSNRWSSSADPSSPRPTESAD